MVDPKSGKSEPTNQEWLAILTWSDQGPHSLAMASAKKLLTKVCSGSLCIGRIALTTGPIWTMIALTLELLDDDCSNTGTTGR